MNNLMSSAVKYVSSFSIVAALAVPAVGCSGGTNVGSGGGDGDAGTKSSSATLCDPEGSWNVQFQWSGRSPGELTMEVAADNTAKILAGDGVGATTGRWSVSNDSITWSFADGSTFSGSATASCSIGAGQMKNTAGKVGSFTADKGGTSGSSSEKKECTSDGQCSSKCSSDCYTCRYDSCKCGRRGVSGACLY